MGSQEISVNTVSIPEATFEDILAQYEQEEGEYDYVVGKGEKARMYRARRMTDLSEKMEIASRAEEFIAHCERIRNRDMKDVPEIERPWKQYLNRKMDKKVALAILYIKRLLVSPRFSDIQLIRMASKCGDALLDIAGPLFSTAEEDATEGTYKEITEAKND